jgi:hypothetical protein
MRFDGEIDRRLVNWARWRAMREDGGMVGSAGYDERVDGTGWDAPTVIPLLDAEAEETQALVLRLEGSVHYAVEVWYRHPGSVAARCKKIQASETEVRKRVALSHRYIGQWLQDKREAGERERDRLEALRRTAVR